MSTTDADKASGSPSPQKNTVDGPTRVLPCTADSARAPRVSDLDDISGQFEEEKTNSVEELMTLCDRGADIKQLLLAMNQTFAVVKYGSKTMVASIVGNNLDFMKLDDFHNMLANLVVEKVVEVKDDSGTSQKTTRAITRSRSWFKWKYRRQYIGRGVVFEPGGKSHTPNDMLNLWRGFGIEPNHGDWSLMYSHIFNVVCSGQPAHYHYLIRWMAYAVQHPDEPMGVAVALLGAQGAGKGIVARTFGKFFGKHFAHIANGEQLTGRFNANIATSCVVFLDEALWAGDKKGEGVLKALITEPSLQLEAKFRDPITVENRLRIIVASNNNWAVPTGIGDRRWFVLKVANTYAGTVHPRYWTALYAEIENGGAAAMLHDLLAMDLSGFNVREVPHTDAKAQQQQLSLHGTEAWLHQVLQEGSIKYKRWDESGLIVRKDDAYEDYKDFSKQQHDWRPETKDLWSKKIRAVLGMWVKDTRQTIGNERARMFQFAPLADCRRQFASHIGAPDLEWDAENEVELSADAAAGQTAENVGKPPEAAAMLDAPSIEWEPDLEANPDNWPEYEPTDE